MLNTPLRPAAAALGLEGLQASEAFELTGGLDDGVRLGLGVGAGVGLGVGVGLGLDLGLRLGLGLGLGLGFDNGVRLGDFANALDGADGGRDEDLGDIGQI